MYNLNFFGEMIRMDGISIKATSKINLGLDIIGKRDDGYHIIDMVLQELDWSDEVVIRKYMFSAEDDALFPDSNRLLKKSRYFVQGNIVLKTIPAEADEYYTLQDGAFDGLDDDERNLAYEAARLMCDTYDIKEKISIEIRKKNPMGAGMGGGSADAAAVIKGINELFELGATEAELEAIGIKLGADVPFCIRGGCARVGGIGEKMETIPSFNNVHVLIVKPDFGLNTGKMYQLCDEIENPIHPDIDSIVSGCRDNDLEKLCANLANMMEQPKTESQAVILDIKERLKQAGAKGALLTGSGSAVFGLFDDESAVREAYDTMLGFAQDNNMTMFITRFKGE